MINIGLGLQQYINYYVIDEVVQSHKITQGADYKAADKFINETSGDVYVVGSEGEWFKRVPDRTGISVWAGRDKSKVPKMLLMYQLVNS